MSLSNCPFCGSEAEMVVSKHIPSGYDYTPRCKVTSCCGRLSKKFLAEKLQKLNGIVDLSMYSLTTLLPKRSLVRDVECLRKCNDWR